MVGSIDVPTTSEVALKPVDQSNKVRMRLSYRMEQDVSHHPLHTCFPKPRVARDLVCTAIRTKGKRVRCHLSFDQSHNLLSLVISRTLRHVTRLVIDELGVLNPEIYRYG